MLEQDRFGFNRLLFIIGMMSMLLSMVLVLLSLYCLPYLIWSLNYSIFNFLPAWKFYFEDIYNFNPVNAGIITFLCLFIPGIILGVVADIISNYIDRSLLIESVELEETQAPKHRRASLFQSLTLFSKIILIMVVVVLLIFFVEWLLSTPFTGF